MDELTIGLVTRVQTIGLPITIPRLIYTFPRRLTTEMVDGTQCRWPRDSRRRLRQLGVPVSLGCRTVLFVRVVATIDVAVAAPHQRDTHLITALPVIVITFMWF